MGYSHPSPFAALGAGLLKFLGQLDVAFFPEVSAIAGRQNIAAAALKRKGIYIQVPAVEFPEGIIHRNRVYRSGNQVS